MSALKITVIGTGYVGLVTGVCLADLGFSVTCVDNNLTILEHLRGKKVPFFEPGLQELMIQNIDADRISFTSDLASAVLAADIIFVAVGTPAGTNGKADLSCVQKVVSEIAPHLSDGVIIVIKSTVPVGTNRAIAEKIRTLSQQRVHVVSNPEFLREGAALQDFLQPDRIIIGSTDPKAQVIMRQLYHFFTQKEVPLLFVNWETAELIKYASNSFLALKIGFANEIANLCEAVGANMPEVSQGMGLDRRIGVDFLKAGPGYGGSCFPKDTEALVYSANQKNLDLSLIRALIKSNETRKMQMVQKIVQACGGSVNEKTIGVLGITFKAETDDLRESPSLVILPSLQRKGASLQVYDPQGMERGVKIFPGVQWCSYAYEAAAGADALVILTEWSSFQNLDFQRLKKIMKQPLLIDLRNLYDPSVVRESGFKYVSIGRA